MFAVVRLAAAAALAVFALAASIPQAAAATANYYIVDTSADDPPRFMNPPSVIALNDAIQFNLRADHGIASADTLDDFNNCKFSKNASLPNYPVGNVSPAILFDQGVGTYYIMCSKIDHCQEGMKFVLEVTVDGMPAAGAGGTSAAPKASAGANGAPAGVNTNVTAMSSSMSGDVFSSRPGVWMWAIAVVAAVWSAML
ncbi:hypothetical protein DFJ73DRAFT_300243 [Zopfochytrium polystomum]|nr:hypothetical protein DFJ73DRAFT_300243 [Zopfochytrium polystomum]